MKNCHYRLDSNQCKSDKEELIVKKKTVSKSFDSQRGEHQPNPDISSCHQDPKWAEVQKAVKASVLWNFSRGMSVKREVNSERPLLLLRKSLNT